MLVRQVSRWGIAATLLVVAGAAKGPALAQEATTEDAMRIQMKRDADRRAAEEAEKKAEEEKKKAEEAERKKLEEEGDDYAVRNSWEVGGAFSFLWQKDEYTVEMSPSVGYFFYDRFEVSAIFNMSWESTEDEDTNQRVLDRSLAFILEPSYHLKIVKQLYVLFAVGTGVGYDWDNVDFELIPRVGLNIVFTHHGVLTPSVRVPIIFDEDGTTVQVGTTLGYTVAF